MRMTGKPVLALILAATLLPGVMLGQGAAEAGRGADRSLVSSAESLSRALGQLAVKAKQTARELDEARATLPRRFAGKANPVQVTAERLGSHDQVSSLRRAPSSAQRSSSLRSSSVICA